MGHERQRLWTAHWPAGRRPAASWPPAPWPSGQGRRRAAADLSAALPAGRVLDGRCMSGLPGVATGPTLDLSVGVHDQEPAASGRHTSPVVAELVGETERAAQGQGSRPAGRSAGPRCGCRRRAGPARRATRSRPRSRRCRPPLAHRPCRCATSWSRVRRWPARRSSKRGSASSSRLAMECSGRTMPRAPRIVMREAACCRATSRQSSVSLSSLSTDAVCSSTPSVPESHLRVGRQRIEVTDDEVRTHPRREAARRATVGRDDHGPSVRRGRQAHEGLAVHLAIGDDEDVARGRSWKPKPPSGWDGGCAVDSLRRYEPDQVPRVCGRSRTLSAAWALPCPM